MGAVASRPDEAAPIFVRDQSRFSVAAVKITNSRGHTLLRITPSAFPATRYSAHRDLGDDSPIEFIQDPDAITSGTPSFLLRLTNADDLIFTFTFVVRQTGLVNGNAVTQTSPTPAVPSIVDTQISSLTYVFASNQKELDNLVVREFHSNPNLHRNPRVELVGDYSTGGSPSVQFDWTWKWQAPKPSEDRGGGWRNTCSFVEYDLRANRLNTLASFNFWVHNAPRPAPRSPLLEIGLPPRLRVPSAQSIESRVSNVSDSEGEGSYKDIKEPQSPGFDVIPENGLGLIPSSTQASSSVPGSGATVKVDVATCRPGEDLSVTEDGPVFRATMRSLEQKTGNMRMRMKKVLRSAEAAESAQQAYNQAVMEFAEALRDAAASNANAVQPAIDHYFEKTAKEILRYERHNAFNLQKFIIDPISKLYNIEIKQADFKKREFDEESKEYYAYVSKYLGQRSESLKEKKQKQSDEKYQAKRRTFELKRFDYSTFMHDLHGGRKDQEVLSQLTKYADAQTRGFLAAAKKIEEMSPHLDALMAEVKAADQDFQLQRTEREEKRRMLEKSNKMMNEDGSGITPSPLQPGAIGSARIDIDQSQPPNNVVAAQLSQSPPGTGWVAAPVPGLGAPTGPPGSSPSLSTGANSKFKGIRDLEENITVNTAGGPHRKEGLLWALSRPGLHVDPTGITKPGWHKFWIVLDQGKLSEYVNWKDRLDLHMEPIDLRVASVREARNSDRRFCFEIITPQFIRVYQAPSEEDMRTWIAAINNALQSAFEARSTPQISSGPSSTQLSSTRKDIAAVLTGKSSSFSGHRQTSNPSRQEAARAVSRHATVGDRPPYRRAESTIAESSALLQRVRSADEGNKVCADCSSDSKVDWCSINLGVLLCIECSGIHRSLGTHISKVRSLTLDTQVFTPDIVELLLLIGNRVSNMVWEAKLDMFLKPSSHSTREQRLHFITAKYSDRTYVQPSSLVSQTIDDFLLTSIKRNDIRSVLNALAQRANPNAHDRSRATHAVYLALAAADPASPASTIAHSQSASLPAVRVSSPPVSPPSPQPRKPFAVAELLLQNGAELPKELPSFPLSVAAQAYMDHKNEQRIGRSTQAAAVASEVNDSLPALPSIASNNSSTNDSRPRERERLIKRNSSGRPSRPSSTTDALEILMKK